jgi:hypothetical protein
MLVPQTKLGENTQLIETDAPRTWAYLQSYGEQFDRRKSAIYRNQPRFAVFGVGDYAFSSWKVAISGLYKKLHFVPVGPFSDKPVVFDDTCYFTTCQSQEEANLLAAMLNSGIAQEFFSALVFWDAKRPITSEILNQLNVFALANELKLFDRLRQFSTSYSLLSLTPQQLTFLP